MRPATGAQSECHLRKNDGYPRRELLDRLLIVNEHHLRQVLTEYLRHYNTALPSPHRALGTLTPTQPDTRPPEPVNLAEHRIRRKQVLRRLTHEYYVAALLPSYHCGTTHVTSQIAFPSPTRVDRPGRPCAAPSSRSPKPSRRPGETGWEQSKPAPRADLAAFRRWLASTQCVRSRHGSETGTLCTF